MTFFYLLQSVKIIVIDIFQSFVVLYRIQQQQLNRLVPSLAEPPFRDKMERNVAIVDDGGDGGDDDDVEIYQNHLKFIFHLQLKSH